jgi:5,5'-dehydrodivanillate O-demethylase
MSPQLARLCRASARRSDVGISMMRQRFLAEMKAMAAGRDPMGVIRDPNAAKCVALPNMARELNTEGVTLTEFGNYPFLRERLANGFQFQFGQPPEVRRAFERAMGIAGN